MNGVVAGGGKKSSKKPKKVVQPKRIGTPGSRWNANADYAAELLNMIPEMKYNRQSRDHKRKLQEISQTLKTKFASNVNAVKMLSVDRVRTAWNDKDKLAGQSNHNLIPTQKLKRVEIDKATKADDAATEVYIVKFIILLFVFKRELFFFHFLTM